tara:strand:+ start:240 stop:500 length:261 start_codon:yes stop_codon:yes gene_type:complete
MPFIKRSGASSEIDQELKSKRQQIIEEERIRVFRESIMLFYDKLVEKYELIHPLDKEVENEDVIPVSREEVEALAGEYADTKPLGF